MSGRRACGLDIDTSQTAIRDILVQVDQSGRNHDTSTSRENMKLKQAKSKEGRKGETNKFVGYGSRRVSV